MVLARKKLKQRLRTLLPSGEADAGVQQEEAQNIKVRLVSSKRPRPKRAKKPPPPKEPVVEELVVEEPAVEEPAVEEPTVEEPTVEEPVEDEAAALARQAKEAELKRRREERRKEKKEKRRVRRLMEAKAAESRKSEAPGADSTVSEDGEQSLKMAEVKVEAEADANKYKLEVAGHAVQSDNPIVSGDSEQSIKKVYVGGIPYYSSEDDIRSFFEGCGSITALDCMTFPESGKFRGIAILTFKTDAAAQRALALDGADMGGFFLKIQPYKANREKVKSNHEKEDFAPKMIQGYNRIYVGNLAWDITEDDLKKFFSDCKISSIRFGTDKETGDFKGFAHVDFSDGTSLGVAMKLDQKVINGRPVRIRCAVPKKESQTLDGNPKPESSKNNIRTCYECGTPGHLSFSCPNKKASEVIPDEKNTNIDSVTASSKKRRTCYECGVPGHLSSACPNKKVAEVVLNNSKPVDEPAPSTIYQEKKVGDESNSAPSKRRKCYECGISGHLSSACPNKKYTQINFDEAKPDGGSRAVPSAIPIEKKTNDDTNPAPPKKKKRRTCYECGIAGHLSSECPNKAAAQVK